MPAADNFFDCVTFGILGSFREHINTRAPKKYVCLCVFMSLSVCGGVVGHLGRLVVVNS